jgi:hypothetical protein
MNENDPSVKMDSATMTSMLDLGENAPPSDKLQASPSPQTTIQDLPQSTSNFLAYTMIKPLYYLPSTCSTTYSPTVRTKSCANLVYRRRCRCRALFKRA